MIQTHFMWVINGPGDLLDNLAEKERARSAEVRCHPLGPDARCLSSACLAHSSRFRKRVHLGPCVWESERWMGRAPVLAESLSRQGTL